MHKFLFLILLILLIPNLLSAQDLLSEFSVKWQNAKAYTIETAQLMPEEDYNYAPTEEIRSFEAQLRHIVSNMVWLSHSYLGNESEFPHDLKKDSYSKSELITILEEGFDYALQSVEALKSDQLNEVVQFFAGPKTKRQILILLNDHVTHHRGQILIYLRMKGIQPPDYRGW